MPKSDFLEAEGVVVGVSPSAIFDVKLTNGITIKAHVSGKVRMNYIRILPGDRVLVHISPYDLERGRIVYRYK